jgi:hypothetical protein
MAQEMTLIISDEMAADLALVAGSEDATQGEVVRDAIRRDLKLRSLMARGPTAAARYAPPQALAG